MPSEDIDLDECTFDTDTLDLDEQFDKEMNQVKDSENSKKASKTNDVGRQPVSTPTFNCQSDMSSTALSSAFPTNIELSALGNVDRSSVSSCTSNTQVSPNIFARPSNTVAPPSTAFAQSFTPVNRPPIEFARQSTGVARPTTSNVQRSNAICDHRPQTSTSYSRPYAAPTTLRAIDKSIRLASRLHRFTEIVTNRKFVEARALLLRFVLDFFCTIFYVSKCE